MSAALSKKERLKISRNPMPEQEPEKRVCSFDEVPLGYSIETAILEAQRCLQCPVPTCIEGCPVRIDIPGFLALVEQGDFLGAAQKIKETNILPAICGRVCPQEEQCEAVCALTKKYTSVAIGRVERFVADYERASGASELPELPPKTGYRVAVVGSGPAGLTVAGEMIRKGHDVTVFEALHRPGGVLVYGIPRFRLPIEVIDHEIDYLKKLGVEFRCNVVIGRLYSIDDLLKEEGYHAVFIGTGAGHPRFLNIPGENLNGVYSANEFLTRVNLMGANKFPEFDTPIVRGERIAVIGAGDTAMDAARTARRLGTRQVTIYYRRTAAEAPCRVEEMHHATEEGIGFEWLTSPVRFLGNERGFLTGVEFQRMELGQPDESGRRRPVPVADSNYVVPAQVAIFALGFNVNPIIAETSPDIITTKEGIIKVDTKTGQTSKPGVFAGGDIITGGATVILAMGQGKIAARSIQEYLTNR
ncbi:MAG: NADPH-dependent glutamate synthase [Candidatus Tectomicrobia bacterium]|nr:NADPH-dependent glutamate synthase [Candidatus Tectomicrobia bacterium]